jgi:hypothetical protein
MHNIIEKKPSLIIVKKSEYRRRVFHSDQIIYKKRSHLLGNATLRSENMISEARQHLFFS